MPAYKTTKVKALAQSSDMSDAEFDGPLKNRSCRDIPCCIFFLAFLGGMGYMAYLAIQQGNPYSLLYGVDSWGNVCNYNNQGVDLTGLKRSFRFDAAKHYLSLIPDMSISSLTQYMTGEKIVVCVSQCPNATFYTAEQVEDFMDATDTNLCQYNVTGYISDATLCPSFPIVQQTPVLNRCVPQQYISTMTQAVSGFVSSMAAATVGPNFAQNVVQDLESSAKEILILCAIAVAAALTMVILMKFVAAVIIWALVIGIGMAGLSATAYCWYTWYTLNTAYLALDPGYVTTQITEEVRTWLIYSGFASSSTAILILILLVLRKRLLLVVQLFKEAGHAIGRMPMLLLQPVWTMIFIAGAMAGLTVLTLYIETTGVPSLDDTTGFVKYTRDDIWTYLRWYHLFGILWITAFMFACQDIIIAGAVATWYFKRKESSIGWPIFAATWRLFRYHLGSVAFGSLIIAIVRFIRLVMAYVQRQMKGRTSKVAEYVLKVIQCCLWFFEKFIAYLNRNAYIEISIYGYGFCKAAQKAFLLILSNVLRVAAINSIGNFVLFLGKIFPVGIVLIVGNELLKTRTDINMIGVPLALASTFAFAIGQCFFGVYEMVIDTIFLCFCEDCERNDGVTKPYFMSSGLMVGYRSIRRHHGLYSAPC